jgi:hypothetical protein
VSQQGIEPNFSEYESGALPLCKPIRFLASVRTRVLVSSVNLEGIVAVI